MRQPRNTRSSLLLIHTLLLLYLGLPVLATALYAFARRWDSTLLPQGYTLAWFRTVLTEARVLLALGRSVLVALATVALIWVLAVPSILAGHLWLPRLQRWLEAAAIWPSAFPPVVMAIGLIQIYSRRPIAIAGTPWILILSYGVICLPLAVGAIGNSLRAIDARTLMEAAECLGASRLQALWYALLPNMVPGIVASGLLIFAVSLGEFVLANMLVGGRYETLQIRLVQLMRFDGHEASALVILFFAVIAAVSLLVVERTQQGAREGRK